MGVVPGPYDVYGWHPFQSGNWNGDAWCAACDCGDWEHVSEEEYNTRRPEFEQQAAYYKAVREEEDRTENKL